MQRQQRIKVLFICTGNYYRSKFCKFYVNCKYKESFFAYSRGIWIDNPDNIGKTSIHTKQFLEKLGISHEKDNLPQLVTEGDLINSEIIIALNKKEHFNHFKKNFPKHLNKIDFWSIPDIEKNDVTSPLEKLKQRIDKWAINIKKNL